MMRKAVTVLSASLPYCYFALFGLMYLLDWDSDLVLLCIVLCFLALSIAISVLYGIFGDLQNNLWVKLACIPADLAVLAFITVRSIENSKAAANGAMGVGLSVFLLILLTIPYVISRLIAMISTAVVCGRNVRGSASIYAFLHIIPVADILSAAITRKMLHN